MLSDPCWLRIHIVDRTTQLYNMEWIFALTQMRCAIERTHTHTHTHRHRRLLYVYKLTSWWKLCKAGDNFRTVNTSVYRWHTVCIGIWAKWIASSNEIKKNNQKQKICRGKVILELMKNEKHKNQLKTYVDINILYMHLYHFSMQRQFFHIYFRFLLVKRKYVEKTHKQKKQKQQDYPFAYILSCKLLSSPNNFTAHIMLTLFDYILNMHFRSNKKSATLFIWWFDLIHLMWDGMRANLAI